MFKALSLLTLTLALALPADARVIRYLTGNPANASAPPAGPALDFAGGGDDIAAGIQWVIDEVRGCTDCPAKIDVVVLRASDSNNYNDYVFAMNGVDSIETLVISKRRDADTAAVEATIRSAEVVFFAGGDQCNYVRNFKGTRVERAVEAVYARGGGVGGTSAGLAIQGDFTYDACRGSATSREALANPYHKHITFTYDFFHWRHLRDTLTDQHLVTRDRLGRTLAFLARQIQDGKAASVLGFAVNEETSVGVDKDGLATVMGVGPAYFILADHPPEVCKPGAPLTYSNFKLWKVPAGGTFNLRDRPAEGYYLRSVDRGVISQDPY
ncbi:MAG TPA: Type 1 glutamine amidotransferase-like domain-containing protein [Thermoanaerobaculia bacterium]|jgi:cyanophycinase|nr:Type 1 glutamine amidotransferase-like domain-containing protein [Thermoanaerobaculia bacterium]